MVTIAVLLLILLVVVIILPVYLVANVIQEAEGLMIRVREGITEARLDELLDETLLHDMVVYLDWAPKGQEEFNERAIIIEHVGAAIQENALQFLRDYGLHVADISRQAGESAAQFIKLLSTWLLASVSFLVNLSLFSFVTVYLLRDYDALKNGLRELVPPRHRPYLNDVMHKIDLQLRSLLRGQVAVCASLAVLYALGLHWADVPFAFPIALFGGAASIVPYIGPMAILSPAVFLTILFYGIGGNLFWVFAVFAVVQVIESYFLTPRVLGSRLGLNPVWIIVAFMVFSTAFGFIGLLVAVPLTAVLKVVLAEAWTYYRKSRFYSEPLLSSTPGNSDGAPS
jgi:predicted PurR-regulated permease PerM